MRFIVLGAGAVGGVIGGRLFEHGHDVTLVARGDHYDALSRHGLRLESPDDGVTLQVPAVSDPADIDFGPDDVVILAVKSQDTAAAARHLSIVAPATIRVVCAQNGVSNEDTVLRWFSTVYGMCVMCPATHLSPGAVQAHSAPVTGLLDLGRWPAGVDDGAAALAGALVASTFESEARPDIARWKWGKLLMNLGNAVEALCGASAWGGTLTTRARHEAVACLEAAGIEYVGRQEDAARRGDLLTHRPAGGVARAGSSSWQSLARSTGAIETDYLNGEIARLGRLHDVPTPVNESLQRVANRFARDRRAPGTMREDELLHLIDG
jgi:2-dehydropantoate 2-reductase